MLCVLTKSRKCLSVSRVLCCGEPRETGARACVSCGPTPFHTQHQGWVVGGQAVCAAAQFGARVCREPRRQRDESANSIWSLASA